MLFSNNKNLLKISDNRQGIIKRETSKTFLNIYECNIKSCGKGFMSKSGLKRHQDTKHQDGEEF